MHDGDRLQSANLRRQCETKWHSQMTDIDMMRNELRTHFGIVDYQPFRNLQPLKGENGLPRARHSGND